jgi:rod shape-determining protein MreB
MTTTTTRTGADTVSGPFAHLRPSRVETNSRPDPMAVAVDLGSGQARIWAVGYGTRAAPAVGSGHGQGTALVRRGRIVNVPGCVCLLTELSRGLPGSLPAGSVVVACRPVLSAPSDDDALRRVMADVFAPSRVLLIDTVRAAAIGSAAAAGVLMVVDVGAQLTEVAVLVDGRVAGARRAETGTSDSASLGMPRLLAGVVTRLVDDIRRSLHLRRLSAAALARGILVVGNGATMPELTTRLADNLRVPVRPAPSPRVVTLSGAGLAAMAASRHPAQRARALRPES